MSTGFDFDEPTRPSLLDRLAECQQDGLPGIPTPELMGYLLTVARELDELHERGLIHRDVKPATMLWSAGSVTLAEIRDEKDDPIDVPLAVTPAYMPPEVFRAHVEGRSDQYSLAVSYFQLKTGEYPFGQRSAVELIMAHMQEPPNLTPLPEAEQAILAVALAKDPEQRFPTCVDFVRELERVT